MCFHPSYFATSLKFFFDKTEIDHWQWPVIESSEGAGSQLWLAGGHLLLSRFLANTAWPCCETRKPTWNNGNSVLIGTVQLKVHSISSPQLSTLMLRSEARKTRLFNMLVLTPVPVYFIPSITYFKARSSPRVQWRQGNWYFWRILCFLHATMYYHSITF